MGSSIKVNLPATNADYINGSGEGVWLLVSDDVRRAYDNDETGTNYTGEIENDSYYYRGLYCGTAVPFEMRGERDPVVPLAWLIEHYGPAVSFYDDPTYKALEEILKNAGIRIIYDTVPDDSIDGAIWARSDLESMAIMMPESCDYPTVERACFILGHEAGHLLFMVDSPDDPVRREVNERLCDLAGALLYRLAEETAGHKAEEQMRLIVETGARP